MRRWLWAALGISGLAAACDKAEIPPGSQDPAATATAPASSPGDGGVDAVAPTLDAGTPSAPLDAGPSAAEAPLAHWMRDHAGAAMQHEDLFALAAAFDQIVMFAPGAPAYANWTSIAKDGAAAARAASLEGTKAACRGCHAQYRDLYRAEMRARPLP